MKYLFGDVLHNYWKFFNTLKNKDTQFIEQICFGFQPWIFDKDEIIYEEDTEASEMYFIITGQIGVGYSLPGTHQTIQKYPIVLNKNKNAAQACCFIGDFYVTSNRKCEF